MASESLRTTTPADNDTSPRRSPSPASLQLLLRGQEVSETLQQTCGEISQTTTAEMVEVANSAVSRSMLQDLLPVYFYSWQLQSPEAVTIHLLLHYYILWHDGSKRREDKEAFGEYIERLKSRVAELEKKLYESQTEVCQMKAELEERREPELEMMRLTKQLQDSKLENEKLLRAHDEVSVSVCLPSDELNQSYSPTELYFACTSSSLILRVIARTHGLALTNLGVIAY